MYLGYGGLSEGIEQLGTVSDDSSALLPAARQETRYVHQREQRDVERVAEPYEPSTLYGRVHVQATWGVREFQSRSPNIWLTYGNVKEINTIKHYALIWLTCSNSGLIGNHAHCPAVHACEARDHVGGKVRHDLEEVTLIHDGSHHLQHVVGCTLVRGNQPLQQRYLSIPESLL